MTTKKRKIQLGLEEIYIVLKHKLKLLIIAGIIGATIIGGINLFLLPPLYTSTTKLYIINRQNDISTTYIDMRAGIQLTQDYMILVQSRPVLEQVIEQTNLGLSVGELSGMITAINPEDTRILEISVTDYDPAMIKMLADAIAEVSSEQMIHIMGIDKVNVVEYANLPYKPDSKNVTKSFLVGATLANIITSLYVVVVYIKSNKLRTSEDIEYYLGIPALAVLPIEVKSYRKLRRVRKRSKVA